MPNSRPTPLPTDWPDDWHERMEAKTDTLIGLIYGDPSDPSKPGMDGRLRSVERDVAIAKRGGLLVATGGLTLFWDFIKRKLGISTGQ